MAHPIKKITERQLWVRHSIKEFQTNELALGINTTLTGIMQQFTKPNE